MPRRILQLDGVNISVSTERRFDSEQDLHHAVASHPEVLPSEDLGLGPLVTLGTELNFGAGPLDLLAADPQGRLVIVEFKRGTENPDVRKVIAQLLDYGASLWRKSYDEVGTRCTGTDGGPPDLAAIAAAGCADLDVAFDPNAFQAGVEAVLESGEFVFLYAARELDERTRRVMTYLAEGPRMRIFAVEVDYFRAGESPSAVLVPRTAFVPSWIVEPSPPTGSSALTLATAEPEFQRLIALMDAFADERGLIATTSKRGRNYQPRQVPRNPKHPTGIAIYVGGKAEFNLLVFSENGREDLVDAMLERIALVAGAAPTARKWPGLPWDLMAHDWDRARATLLEPYFDARAQLV